jgi:hypothetical protein
MKKLTSEEKAIVKNLNSALYTVEYLEEWINNNDDVFSNAVGALTAMGAKGFYDAIQLQVKIQKKIRDEYMVSGICLALAEIASGAEIVEVLENADITKEFAESCGVDNYDIERLEDEFQALHEREAILSAVKRAAKENVV